MSVHHFTLEIITRWLRELPELGKNFLLDDRERVRLMEVCPISITNTCTNSVRDRVGGNCSIRHHAMGEGPWADEVTVGELPLGVGQTMTFLFDFGDCRQFDVKLERVEPCGGQDEARIHWKPRGVSGAMSVLG